MYDEDIKEFVRLENEKRRLNTELKVVEQSIDKLKEVLIPRFIEMNRRSDSIDGRTVYIQRSIYPAMVNGRAAVVAALQKAGLEDLIGVNHKTLASFVKQVGDEAEDIITRENDRNPPEQHRISTEADIRNALPEALRDEISITFKHDLKSTKA